jgi:hypothetical protein
MILIVFFLSQNEKIVDELPRPPHSKIQGFSHPTKQLWSLTHIAGIHKAMYNSLASAANSIIFQCRECNERLVCPARQTDK